jgi:hypothetical protein
MVLHRFGLLAFFVCISALAFAQEPVAQKPAVESITPEGKRLAAALDSMDVEHLWLPGQRVAWKTGKPLGPPSTDSKSHTHCSAFAAAAGEKFGIYLLHPPEHSSTLLANAQYDWLASDDGRKNGWKSASDAFEAQSLANRGYFVVAVYKEPNPKQPGHIAVVRPSDRSADLIRTVGPAITQAGGQNLANGDLRDGFRRHAGAFPDKIRYYAHAVKENQGKKKVGVSDVPP